MNNLKKNPVGIDIKIQEIQKKLIKKLSSWNLESYGRVNLDKNKNLRWFVKVKDYKNVLSIEDKFNGTFFFVENDETKTNNQISSTKIDLVFLLNLEKIKTNIIHRADEEVKVEILKVLRSHLTRVSPLITKGNKALEGFNTDLQDNHPYHFLRFTFTIQYNNF